MNKELDRYRDKLKTQNIVFSIAALVIAAFIVLGLTGVIEPAVGSESWAGFWNGFYSGVSTAFVGIMILGVVINCTAMRDEEKLKKLYIKENDEREQEIAKRAGGMSMWFETVGLLMGAIIGGYFSCAVSLTCLGCLLFVCFVRIGLKIYYCNKL